MMQDLVVGSARKDNTGRCDVKRRHRPVPDEADGH